MKNPPIPEPRPAGPTEHWSAAVDFLAADDRAQRLTPGQCRTCRPHKPCPRCTALNALRAAALHAAIPTLPTGEDPP